MTLSTFHPSSKVADRDNATHDRASSRSDPFRYGWRFERVATADGQFELREIPLTWQDLLDPKEGDQMIQATVHTQTALDLFWMLRDHYLDRDDVAVFHDLKMLWGIAGLSQPGPDLAVVPSIRDKHRNRPSFDVPKEGTRPCLIIEVVSPEYRNKDYVDLPPIYARAGIEEYLIVDPGPAEGRVPFRLTGYRLDAGGHYRRIVPDRRGRLFSATTDLYFAADPGHPWVNVENARDGKPLLRPDQQRSARREAEQRAAEETARADREAASCREAETRAATEAEHAAREAAYRRQAEARAAGETAKRRALEIELARLRRETKQGRNS
jgi:Uma2 family endonuclease